MASGGIPPESILVIATEEHHARWRRSVGWVSGEWKPEQLDIDGWLDSVRPAKPLEEYPRVEVWDVGDSRSMPAYVKACEELGELHGRVRLVQPPAEEADEAEERARDRLRRRRLEVKEADRWAEEVLAAKDAASDQSPAVARFSEELDEELDEEDWLVQGLIPVDGRAVIGGFRKAGKTVLDLNLASSLASGEDFLGAYAVRKPNLDRSTLWMNLELTRRTARRWVHAIGEWTDPEAMKRIVGVHARGAVSTYAITGRAGEYALERLLTETAAETLIVDPVAPLMAVCGLDVNAGKDVGRFLTRMDRILHRVGVAQVVYCAHVGKSASQDEGNETVKGDTRWEDAVDSIIIIGKERNSGTRWIRAEGRDVELDNATLVYDLETRRLTLDAGTSRRDAELRTCAEQVLAVVRIHPGVQTESLLGDVRITGTKAKRKAGRDEAARLGWIAIRPGHGAAIEHWPLV